MSQESQYRLPRSVVPSHYVLVMEPDLEAASFTGSETVTVEVREPVTEIVLNAVDLVVDEAWLEGAGGRLDAKPTYDAAAERVSLALTATAEPGTWTLHARFRGVLNDKLRGFYRSTYTDDEGRRHVLACTQFEATDARRAFPCWDEPDLKASFGVTLVVADGLLALSNAAMVSEEVLDDGRCAVHFADTMSMSTYLVAFIVGELELTPPVDVDGVPLRVAHVPGKGHLTGFALEAAAFCLRWFSDYYAIPYPGDKVDLIAVPDFASGAMENLGCITFREALLLVDPDTSTQQEQQLVADVVAHELAHMWFGDLVTMRWWNGIWLNEAFATFMETLAVDAFKPDWQRWVTFGLERTTAFDVDALVSTRPIEYPVHSPADADGMFDVLTYQKGAAVLRMLEQYLGAEEFRAGIRSYLERHAYANTETTDLWDAIEASSGEPVRRIMDSWIFQGGYPLVEVAPAAGDGSARLTQRRFLYDQATDGDTRWVLPLLVRRGGGEDAPGVVDRHLLDADASELTVASQGDGATVVNAGGHGFYRVRYDRELLGRLLGPNLRTLSSIERYGLVDDAWAAVLAGAMTAAEFCELARSFSDEADLAVWQLLSAALGQLDRLVEGEPRARFQAFVRGLAAPLLMRLGWQPAPDESKLTGELRGVLIRTVALTGADEAAQARAAELHARAVADPASVDPTVAAAVISVVAGTGGLEHYEQFLERFRAATTPQEQLRYLYALADFDDAGLMARTLELSLSEVRTQNAPFLLARAMRNRSHGPAAWSFVRQQWATLNERFPKPSIIRMLDGLKSLNTPEAADEAQAFFAEHDVPQAAKTLRQLLERQRVNVALRERESSRLAAVFS